MSDEKRAFTVSDRRHFTRDGETRPEAESQDAPAADAPRAATADASAREPRSPAASAPRDDAKALPPVTFESFLVSIAAQAGALMQGAPAEGDQPAIPPDLLAARQTISILEMLEDKTEGRRTERESSLLESLLFELRMVFVEASRRAGQ